MMLEGSAGLRAELKAHYNSSTTTSQKRSINLTRFARPMRNDVPASKEKAPDSTGGGHNLFGHSLNAERREHVKLTPRAHPMEGKVPTMASRRRTGGPHSPQERCAGKVRAAGRLKKPGPHRLVERVKTCLRLGRHSGQRVKTPAASCPGVAQSPE